MVAATVAYVTMTYYLLAATAKQAQLAGTAARQANENAIRARLDERGPRAVVRWMDYKVMLEDRRRVDPVLVVEPDSDAWVPQHAATDYTLIMQGTFVVGNHGPDPIRFSWSTQPSATATPSDRRRCRLRARASSTGSTSSPAGMSPLGSIGAAGREQTRRPGRPPGAGPPRTWRAPSPTRSPCRRACPSSSTSQAATAFDIYAPNSSGTTDITPAPAQDCMDRLVAVEPAAHPDGSGREPFGAV